MPNGKARASAPSSHDFDSGEKDGKCNPGLDGWRRNVDVVESCEGQSDAVGKGEGSDGLHQHPAVLHEQKQSEYEQQMVDTKQDVLNAVLGRLSVALATSRPRSR